jgi:hypothetical protein
MRRAIHCRSGVYIRMESSAGGPTMIESTPRPRFTAAIGRGRCQLISLSQEALLDLGLAFDARSDIRELVRHGLA